jgi:hypothetical protein
MRHLDQAASVTEGRFDVVIVNLALDAFALVGRRSGSDEGREVRGVDGPPSRSLDQAWAISMAFPT